MLIFIGCKKENIASGINTRVYGKFSDYLYSPIPNAKLKVGEYKFKFNSVNGGTHIFQKWTDSTYTNSNGEYDFTFRTSGQGSLYKLTLDNSLLDTQQKYWSLLDPVEIKNIGSSFNYSTNEIVLLYPCDVTINLNNIVHFPIEIHHKTTRKSGNDVAINSNSIYVRRIYIDEYFAQTLSFYRTKPNGVIQKATFQLPATNTRALTTQNITLNEIDFIDI